MASVISHMVTRVGVLALLLLALHWHDPFVLAVALGVGGIMGLAEIAEAIRDKARE